MTEPRQLSPSDKDYPARLRDALQEPPSIWIHGQGTSNPEKTVGIIGTRSPFYKAAEIAQAIGQKYGAAGYTIVSGYATGVDSFGHIGAMDASAPTVAVLGSGILKKQPPKPALERYVLSSGLFLSAVSDPNRERTYGELMARDVITAALSDILIVVETDAAGGAVHTAGIASRQGHLVYAVVWSKDEKYSKLADCLGSDALVQAGIAKPLPIVDAGKEFLDSLPGIEMRR